ncbi:MAG: hypothetical protein U1D99_00580, partial [Candidatus Omnitrophota bacterium]|nr:hypothetical protein [Candidatus Omnitrophota bacterium]
MPAHKPLYHFLPDGVSFTSREIARMRLIYLPLSGTTADGLKSCVTPFLGGDVKIDKNTFVTRPASREDLRQALRDFFVLVRGKGVFSLAAESSPDSASVEIGQLWQ